LSRKTVLASLVFAAFLLLSGAPAAKANGWEDCHRRISYTEMRYQQAVERFGPYSSAARHWAEERAEAYARLERYRRTHFREGHDDDRDRDRR
jgi:hypothetical protein